MLALPVQGTRLHIVDTDTLATVRELGPFAGEIDWYPFWNAERIVVISGKCEVAVFDVRTGERISQVQADGNVFSHILGWNPDQGLLCSSDDRDML